MPETYPQGQKYGKNPPNSHINRLKLEQQPKSAWDAASGLRLALNGNKTTKSLRFLSSVSTSSACFHMSLVGTMLEIAALRM